MKEKLTAIREVLETVEVRGKENLHRLLACLNSLDNAIADLDKTAKERESA